MQPVAETKVYQYYRTRTLYTLTHTNKFSQIVLPGHRKRQKRRLPRIVKDRNWEDRGMSVQKVCGRVYKRAIIPLNCTNATAEYSPLMEALKQLIALTVITKRTYGPKYSYAITVVFKLCVIQAKITCQLHTINFHLI